MYAILRVPCIILLLSSHLLPIYAQDSQNATFELTGRVVNDATGEPVARALVEINTGGLRRHGASPASASEPDPTFTDASGNFHFRGLPSGNYGINVTKPQFQTKVEFVEIGSAPKNIELALTRLGGGHRKSR